MRDSLVAQMVENPSALQETPVQFLGLENPLEEGMATHSSILAWRRMGSHRLSPWGRTESDMTEGLNNSKMDQAL